LNPQGFYWSSAEDSWQGSTSRDNTLARWATHIQNDFRARMDWTVNPKSGANHEPVPVLNGIPGTHPVTVTAAAGETVKLSAQGSSDPDGQTLSFQWVYYPEPGSYRGGVTVDSPRAVEATVRVPADARSGQTMHVVLIATDGGAPPLTRYRRAIITAR